MRKQFAKKAVLLSSLFLFTAFLTQPAAAEENEPEPVTLTVELEDVNAIHSIKAQLIELKVDETLYPELKENINIEESELILEGLDISKLGIQDVMVHFTMKVNTLKSDLLFNNVITEKIRIQVVDTTAPTIVLKYEHITMDFEEVLDPMEWIESILDNSREEMKEVQADMSSLDNTTPGDYQITYTATDVNGNTGKAILNVTVKPKKVAYSNYGTSSDSITAMLNLMNSKRAEAGLNPLSLGDANAQAAIGVRACEAAENVSHTRPDGRHYKTAFDDYGVTYSSPYEILTYSGSTVQDKFDWWMSSSSHRADILRASSTKVAIGYCGKMWAAIVYE